MKSCSNIILLLSCILLSSCAGDEIEIRKISFNNFQVKCGALPSDSYNSLQFVSSSQAYTVSVTGKIYKTENYGVDWTMQISGTDQPLFDIFFLDEVNGYVVGGSNQEGIILKTLDGGINWSILNFTVEENLKSIHFINVLTGFAVGNNVLLKTIDGGLSWNKIILGDSYNLSEVNFYNESIGFIAGWPSSLKTIDGGLTWVELNSKVAGAGHIQILDEIVFFHSKSSSKILKTRDFGITWLEIKNIPIVNSFHFINQNQAIAVGNRYPPLGFFPNGVVYLTNDSGKNWIEKEVETTQFYDLIDINTFNDTIFYSVGNTYNGCIAQIHIR